VVGTTNLQFEAGVSGASESGPGIHGFSSTADGVLGSSGKNGVHGQSSSPGDSGVWGENQAKGYGVSGSTNSDLVLDSTVKAGVWGDNKGGGAGVKGTSQSGNGVIGFSNSPTAAAVSAVNTAGGYGLYGSSPNGKAIYCDGDHHCTGTMTVDKDIVMPAADFAEDFTVDGCNALEPGTVMVINAIGALRPCEKPYDRKVAGVISGAGSYRTGLILDRQKNLENRLPIALVGKVYCKVDASCGSVDVGDLLTTSATPGHAMKACDQVRAFGSVIGKALQPLGEGRGLIAILIALQ
jgi:hypothetical protein